MPDCSPATLSFDEACRYLGVTVYQLRVLVRGHRVAAINMNGSARRPRYRFRQLDLDVFLAREAEASLAGEMPIEAPIKLTPSTRHGMKPIRL